MRILSFPQVRQVYDYDCGAAAAQAVLGYFGIDVGEDKIMKIAGTRKKSGTSPAGIIKIWQKYGLEGAIKKLSLLQIKKEIDKGRPVVVLLQAWSSREKVDWENNWADGHYAVVIGYDKKKIYFEDPFSLFRVYLSYAEFQKRWHGFWGVERKSVLIGIVVVAGRRQADFKKFIKMR